MIFHSIREKDCLTCWASEHGRWRLAVTPTVMGSLRLNVWCFGDDPHGYCRVYCCGEAAAATLVTRLILKILEDVEEAIDAGQMAAMLPAHSIEEGRELRPITTDARLWHTLTKLAGIDSVKAAIMFDALRMLSVEVMRGN